MSDAKRPSVNFRELRPVNFRELQKIILLDYFLLFYFSFLVLVPERWTAERGYPCLKLILEASQEVRVQRTCF